MFKRNSIFSKLFLSYSFIFLLSILLFITVFFYLFHLTIYKEYEKIYEHHYVQMETKLTTKESDAESMSYLLNQPTYAIYIVDSENRQIFGPNPEETDKLVPVSEQLLQRVHAGEKVAEGQFENGELQYTIGSKLATTIDGMSSPMMIMVFHSLTHEYKQVLFIIVITFFIAILFAGIILWFFSKRITAPLREMSDITKRYAKGDFSTSVTYPANDEISQLATSLSNMAQELNELDTRRKQFVSNVSHELRSPLTSIKGFIIALMDGTIQEERRMHYYRLMKNETERMIKLVNDTLAINQLEEGDSNLSCIDYNLTEQINHIVHALEPHVKKKHLRIALETEEDFYVYADKERIERVLVNLLQNAIQFSKEQSQIDVSLKKVGQFVKVNIRDYGEGIKEEDLPLIWRRFYKADESRTSKSGAGLGLAIVKSILDLHGVEANVVTEYGKGATFSFTLRLSGEK